MTSVQPNWPVIDFHCDVLYKMHLGQALSFEDPALDVTRSRMKEGGVDLQTFAIFIPQQVGSQRFEHIVRQVELFREHIAYPDGGLSTLRWREEAAQLSRQAGNAPEMGEQKLQKAVVEPPAWGLLSLEGADALEGNLEYIRLSYELGIRLIGITWNYANWAGDGVLEQRNAGLTNKGREMIRYCNKLGMLLDVSHLSESGFWEVMEQSDTPPVASHSNARHVQDHVRNLLDEQIRALIARDGRIGLVFYPPFVKDGADVRAEDLLPHIEHICSLGGAGQIMLGSDFDGMDQHVHGLSHPGDYPAWAGLLLKHYPEGLVRGWLAGNALGYLAKHLPQAPISSAKV
ncbi:dipeptidase [Paenibacillus massiliensis]|uniref:dipeptidase n=1 Tax=Paenibacillus massiliensis TaxID=225917 RepID=UPI00046F1259|nr:dipeptidase [Paenibacillus massiliensis]